MIFGENRMLIGFVVYEKIAVKGPRHRSYLYRFHVTGLQRDLMLPLLVTLSMHSL